MFIPYKCFCNFFLQFALNFIFHTLFAQEHGKLRYFFTAKLGCSQSGPFSKKIKKDVTQKWKTPIIHFERENILRSDDPCDDRETRKSSLKVVVCLKRRDRLVCFEINDFPKFNSNVFYLKNYISIIFGIFVINYLSFYTLVYELTLICPLLFHLSVQRRVYFLYYWDYFRFN